MDPGGRRGSGAARPRDGRLPFAPAGCDGAAAVFCPGCLQPSAGPGGAVRRRAVHSGGCCVVLRAGNPWQLHPLPDKKEKCRSNFYLLCPAVFGCVLGAGDPHRCSGAIFSGILGNYPNMYDCSGKSKKWGKFAKKILTKVQGAGILTKRITEAQLIPGRSERDSGVAY